MSGEHKRVTFSGHAATKFIFSLGGQAKNQTRSLTNALAVTGVCRIMYLFYNIYFVSYCILFFSYLETVIVNDCIRLML